MRRADGFEELVSIEEVEAKTIKRRIGRFDRHRERRSLSSVVRTAKGAVEPHRNRPAQDHHCSGLLRLIRQLVPSRTTFECGMSHRVAPLLPKDHRPNTAGPI